MVQINSAETGRAKSARQWTLRPESKGKEKMPEAGRSELSVWCVRGACGSSREAQVGVMQAETILETPTTASWDLDAHSAHSLSTPLSTDLDQTRGSRSLGPAAVCSCQLRSAVGLQFRSLRICFPDATTVGQSRLTRGGQAKRRATISLNLSISIRISMGSGAWRARTTDVKGGRFETVNSETGTHACALKARLRHVEFFGTGSCWQLRCAKQPETALAPQGRQKGHRSKAGIPSVCVQGRCTSKATFLQR
ncbi:hypothetical protein L1887_60917 [Cichorium endivia]|nr:hypothetical protein L1887_60917 [Cichorium endivia]